MILGDDDEDLDEGDLPRPSRSARAARSSLWSDDWTTSGGPPDDLPLLRQPPGYYRDHRGRWRYVATGERVPGAADITLARLYGNPRRGSASMEVPTAVARSEEELLWCLDVGAELGFASVPRATGRRGRRGRTISVLLVPRAEWQKRAKEPLGMTAPELAPDRLLDLEAVARATGVERATMRAYLARGQGPEPVAYLGGSPMFTRPVVRHWSEARPGQGVGGGPKRSRRGARRPRAIGAGTAGRLGTAARGTPVLGDRAGH